MDRAEISAALEAVGRRLVQRGLQGEPYLVGGAALALAYDARRTTRDVDAVFEPELVLYQVATEVAQERGLPPDWLNDGVKGFLPGPDPFETPVLELPGLRVQAASPQMLLALKVLAHRVDVDDGDVRFLVRLLDLRTADQVLDLVERMLGPGRLTPQAQFFMEAVMEPPSR